jgi:phage terminase large subunit-like protein
VAKKPTKAAEIALRYAESVSAGDLPACRWTRLACERHLRDLDDGEARGLSFDPAGAAHAVDFFDFLKHSKGEWAGQTFRPSPWQVFLVASLFGWKREDGFRRFRIAYIEVPRKSGKSTLAAGVGLYLFFADGEPGAEVYTAATKRDQARITHGEATRMVRSSAALKRHIGIYRDNLHVLATASKFEPLGADADFMDGLNPHGVIVDELHAHRTREVWDVLETATSARRQPLMFAITTAGYDRESICWELHEYAVKVLDGVIEDDTFFAFVSAGDEGDDWSAEEVWAKANPALGVSVKLDDLRRKAAKAKETPAAQNAFRRLHLCEWTQQEERWLDLEDWNACAFPVDPEALRGRRCFAGLDLSSTTDLSALVLYFPRDDGLSEVLPYFWMPGDNIVKRMRRDRVPFTVWAEEGWIDLTEGNIVDYAAIRAKVHELAETYEIAEIAYDRWNATGLITQLADDGLTVTPFGQGFASMSAPTKELEKLVLGHLIAHGGHPVLRWNIANVMVRQDPAGNYKIDKAKSRDRVDGAVALAMAIGRAMVTPSESRSIYDECDPILIPSL